MRVKILNPDLGATVEKEREAADLMPHVKRVGVSRFTVEDVGKKRTWKVYLERLADGRWRGGTDCPGWEFRQSFLPEVPMCSHLRAVWMMFEEFAAGREVIDAIRAPGQVVEASVGAAADALDPEDLPVEVVQHANGDHDQLDFDVMPTQEAVAEHFPQFADLPTFGLMIYRGKPYIKKEGLVFGFRRDHPTWQMETLLVENGEEVLYRTVIRNDAGGVVANGYGSASKQNTKINRLHEMAETRSVCRAIRVLYGFPLGFSGELVKARGL